MDSLTHIYFADRLLKMVGGDPAAAVCSLFPQIDRRPAYLHRMYAHPFFQICRLSSVGSEVYRTGQIATNADSEFDWQRFTEERNRMQSFTEQFARETNTPVPDFAPDRISVLIGYVSHTYQDIFNNPMQAFLPMSVYPCGKWELWSELDSIGFRTVLYRPENISAFRAEVYSASLWQSRLDGVALLKAMIKRTAVASIVQVAQSLVDEAYMSLGLDYEPNSVEVTKAEELLVEHEHLLSQMIRKYSGAQVHGRVVPIVTS